MTTTDTRTNEGRRMTRAKDKRLGRENAESQAAWYWCRQHPERARDANMHCDECIAAGYELRVRAARVGGRILHTITLPQDARGC